MTTKYVFKKKAPLIAYIAIQLKNPTPVRMHKTLYFLWAFYAAGYGELYDDDNPEFQAYPPYLFPAKFGAYCYGPALWNHAHHIYNLNDRHLANLVKQVSQSRPQIKEKGFAKFRTILKKTMMNQTNPLQGDDILNFIDDMIQQADQIYDYRLAIRSQQDVSWQNQYRYLNKYCQNDPETARQIHPENIKQDYQKYLKDQPGGGFHP